MNKANKALFKRIWRKARSTDTVLIPTEWHSLTLCDTVLNEKSFPPHLRQKYFDSLYGNIYQKVNNYGFFESNVSGNHVFISALVGAGRYTSITWLDIQKSRKWEDSFDHSRSHYEQWVLVAELEVNP